MAVEQQAYSHHASENPRWQKGELELRLVTWTRQKEVVLSGFAVELHALIDVIEREKLATFALTEVL